MRQTLCSADLNIANHKIILYLFQHFVTIHEKTNSTKHNAANDLVHGLCEP